MASILPSSVIGDIRGSIGAQAYSRNQYGLYVKARKTPTNPNTAAQIAARNALAASVAAWKALTQAQRDKYNALGDLYKFRDRLGVTRTLNGYLIYIRQRRQCARVGLPFKTDIAAPQESGRYRFNTFSLSLALLNFEVHKTGGGTLDFFAIFAGPAQGASRNSFNPSKARYIKSGTALITLQTITMKTEYEAIYGVGSWAVGQRIFIGLQSFNPVSATSGEIQYASSIVV